MHRSSPLRTWGLLAALLAAAAPTHTRADGVSAVQVLRAGGCGGLVPIAPPLTHSASLDRAAREWAAGQALAQSVARSGYVSASTSGVHVAASDSTLLEQLRRSDCGAVTNPGLRQIGSFHRGSETWVVMAAGTAAPAEPGGVAARQAAPLPSARPVSQVPLVAPIAVLSHHALELVNEVRARGVRCGERSFAPAPPLTLSGTLGTVAYGHATDMAVHNYFEHEDLAGQTPADRVRAVGYHEKLVGENIAYGPQTVDEVVQGWLASAGHCENIMDPRFAEMGLAFAAGHGSKHGLYWVQLLAEPRA
jgi:uncharacterized protein YkwD